MKLCYKCNNEIKKDKIDFHDICYSCKAYLHCCTNCKFYNIGKPNKCEIPNIEPVADKEKFNFCDEFMFFESEITLKTPKKPKSHKDIIAEFEKLFKK